MIEQIPATAYNTAVTAVTAVTVVTAVTAANDRQDDGRDRRRDGSGKSAGDVEHAEILGIVVFVGQHVGNKREVDGHVQAEAEAADGHADEVAVEVAGDGDGEHRQAVHGRGGQDEDSSVGLSKAWASTNMKRLAKAQAESGLFAG